MINDKLLPMNLALEADWEQWEAGDFEEFALRLVALRKAVPPYGLSQSALATLLVQDLGLAALVRARADRDTASAPPISELLSARFRADRVFGTEVGSHALSHLLPFVDEAAALSRTNFQSLIRLHQHGAEEAALEELRGLVAKWRSRIANLESARKTSRHIARSYLVWIHFRAELRDTTPEDILASPQSELLPYWGKVPRKTSMQELSGDEDELIVVPEGWLEAHPTVVVQVATDEYSPIFQEGEMVGVFRSHLRAPGVAALMISPEGELGFWVIAEAEGGGRPWIMGVNALGLTRATPEWELLGYAVCRSLVSPEGIEAGHRLVKEH